MPAATEGECLNRLSFAIIGAGLRVHTVLGPGMKESSYEECLAAELTDAGLRADRQTLMPVHYRGRRMRRGYRVDLIVEEAVAVEVKAVTALAPIHRAQLRAYLKQSKLKLGLLLISMSPTFATASNASSTDSPISFPLRPLRPLLFLLRPLR